MRNGTTGSVMFSVSSAAMLLMVSTSSYAGDTSQASPQAGSQTSSMSTTHSTTTGSMSPQSITAQDLNQNASRYVGKQVALSGKVDRVLGNGAYIVEDTRGSQSNGQKAAHRVLILTTTPSTSAMRGGGQQAGIAAPSFKEGDKIQLQGKAEQFNISSEVDAFAPKTDTETIEESSSSMPVVVVKPGGLQSRS